MVANQCHKCGTQSSDPKTRVVQIGSSKKWKLRHEDISYRWFNRALNKMEGMPVGPCRECHEVKVEKIFMLLDTLVRLDILRKEHLDQ